MDGIPFQNGIFRLSVKDTVATVQNPSIVQLFQLDEGEWVGPLQKD